MKSAESVLATIKKLPKTRISKHLEAFLDGTIAYSGKVAQLCRKLYVNVDNPENLMELLAELSNEGERYCYSRRICIDSMLETVCFPRKIRYPAGLLEANVSSFVSISYNEGANTLHITMPHLLPLKTKWNSYLPDKIRYALQQFDSNIGQGKIRISPAFVLFIHHYNAHSRKCGYYRDYDNMEYSSVLNALHSTLIFNDNAATCITTQMAVPDSTSFTEVVVAPVEKMMDVLHSMDLSLYKTEDEKG